MTQKNRKFSASVLNVGSLVSLVALTTLGSISLLTLVVQQPIQAQNSTNLERTSQEVRVNKELKVSLANSSKTTESLPLQKGIPYKEARQLLLQQGWRPNLQGEPPNLRSLAVRGLYDLGYVEIEDCSGTGEGPCRFRFINDNGDLLFVVTIPVGNPNLNPNLGPFVRNWWVEKKTDTTQKNRSFNQIIQGRYWLGATDQALEVKGEQYRYYSEAGAQPWQPISELKYIKNGVVFDGKTYWCLSRLAPQNGVTVCSANGWAASEKLPFVGTRRFNFLGGTGTGQSITIKADGSTVVQLHGTMSSLVLYRGQFSNPIILDDGTGLLLRGNKVQMVSSDGQVVTSCNGQETCETELY